MQSPTSDPITSEDSDACSSGDFVDSDDEFILKDFVENVDEHEYYPICLGEVIEKRYRIVHKLGHGAFSTVWLAHDLQKEDDVALKVMVAGCEAEHELHMQNEIIRRMKDTSSLLLYQNTFSLPGRDRDRNHHVLVLPVRGPSLGSYHTRKMSMTARISAARELLKTLESLHRRGIIHGDVSGGNVLWDMVSSGKYNTATKYKYLNRPEKMARPPETWKVGELVVAATIPQSLLGEKIYLSDFGLATDINNQINTSWQPPLGHCSPEIMHKFPASFASDTWGYMCIFMNLYLGASIFAGGLGRVVGTLGPMPEEWKALIETDDEWYDQNKRVDARAQLRGRIIFSHARANITEQDHVISIILAVLRYSMGERLTATQLLHDSSFRELMDIYCP